MTPKVSSALLQRFVLCSSQLFVVGKLSYMLESSLPKGFQNDILDRGSKVFLTRGIVTPRLKQEPQSALVVVLVVFVDNHAHCPSQALVVQLSRRQGHGNSLLKSYLFFWKQGPFVLIQLFCLFNEHLRMLQSRSCLPYSCLLNPVHHAGFREVVHVLSPVLDGSAQNAFLVFLTCHELFPLLKPPCALWVERAGKVISQCSITHLLQLGLQSFVGQIFL